jgi:hypothetical protein
MKNVNVSFGGFSFFALATTILVVLKLCEVLTCSWYVVFIPMFVYFGILFCMLMMFLFGLAMIFISARMKAKENKNNNILSDDELTNCIHNMVNKLEKDDKEEKEQ